MLVLLKVETDQILPFALPAAVQNIRVGQWAIALGRTFQTEQANVSIGIVSAKERIWGKAIQTDAKISPNNYGGPLVDIHGRVMGILVPMSPQGQNEVAGAEWYDSGIGFAIPLEHIHARLEVMSSGNDIHRGLIGITLKGRDIYGDPPVIATVRPNSPAAQNGLMPGDTFQKIDGQSIQQQAQFKHVLGSLDAGQTLSYFITRGDNSIRGELKLVHEIDPYEHPFLGILPDRSQSQSGVKIRYVFADGPADMAGLKANDVIVKLNNDLVTDANWLRDSINALHPADTIALTATDGESEREIKVVLERIPDKIPDVLPTVSAVENVNQDAIDTGLVDIKIPEESSKCVAYVPSSYDSNHSYGLLVVLPLPGKFDQDRIGEQWKDVCEQHRLIVLAPKSTNDDRWLPIESVFIKKAIEEVRTRYTIDDYRIVVHGTEGGAAMAYLLAFAHRDLIRGLAPLDAAVPTRLRVPLNEPANRLAILLFEPEESKQISEIRDTVADFRKQKFPLTIQSVAPRTSELTPQHRETLARWSDTLDRI